MEVFGQRDEVDCLLLFSELNHALVNAAVLVEKEILGAQLFNGRVQRVIVEQNRAEDTALGLQILGKRSLDRGVVCHCIRFIFAEATRCCKRQICAAQLQT